MNDSILEAQKKLKENVKDNDCYQDNRRQYKVGDIVQLKSGGPSMVINMVDDNQIQCLWFFDGEVYAHDFNANVLTPYVIQKFATSFKIHNPFTIHDQFDA